MMKFSQTRKSQSFRRSQRRQMFSMAQGMFSTVPTGKPFLSVLSMMRIIWSILFSASHPWDEHGFVCSALHPAADVRNDGVVRAPSVGAATTAVAAAVTIEGAAIPGRPAAVRRIYVCGGCADPARDGGSRVEAIVASRGPRGIGSNVTGVPLAYAVPNEGFPTAEAEDDDGWTALAWPAGQTTTERRGGRGRGRSRRRRRLYNEDEILGCATLLHRGGRIPIVHKVLQAQDAGAAAAIVIDDGRCDESFRACGGERYGGKSAAEDGFGGGTRGDWSEWARVKIPTVLVTERGGARLRETMSSLEMIDFGIGLQYVSSTFCAGNENGGAAAGPWDEL